MQGAEQGNWQSEAGQEESAGLGGTEVILSRFWVEQEQEGVRGRSQAKNAAGRWKQELTKKLRRVKIFKELEHD